MKARIPIIIQDPRTSSFKGMEVTEGFDPDKEDFFLDGPVTRRVAILDFDPETGELFPGARFVPPKPGNKRGHYEDSEGNNLYDATDEDIYGPEFLQVSTFAVVLKTLYQFERKEALGRSPLKWAFDSPQLLVIPRAGKKPNAYYHRDSASLQFFQFASEKHPDIEVYTCLSRDIVAHETGHAIIDAIAPDLLDASSPQSIAIHEALADLTALLMAFFSHTLSHTVLNQMHGSIKEPSAFSTIAEEFAAALGKEHGLRNLINKRTLDPADKKNSVVRYEPHLVSEVLSGALYNVMIEIHEDLKLLYSKKEKYADKHDPVYSASGEALAKGAERFQRMVFRALDYLPPGEVSFADFGRAMIAVDRIAYPDDNKMRQWIRREFKKRYITQGDQDLELATGYKHPALADVNVKTLLDSDWTAYQFANENRELLGIPQGIPFEVRPRLVVSKKYDKDRERKECIFKVAWEHVEKNALDGRYPARRRITVGSTLALDWEFSTVLVRLTTAPPQDETVETRGDRIHGPSPRQVKEQREDRDRLLKHLIATGRLAVGEDGFDPDGKPLLTHVQAESTDDIMRTRGVAKMLHILKED